MRFGGGPKTDDTWCLLGKARGAWLQDVQAGQTDAGKGRRAWPCPRRAWGWQGATGASTGVRGCCVIRGYREGSGSSQATAETQERDGGPFTEGDTLDLALSSRESDSVWVLMRPGQPVEESAVSAQ